ncbi:hypothetical protein PsAD26_04608 [Pseudovibrio sp. Ad26]|nr:hypothetical protein PsAD26_04608 [Pseudovibrio sp. Ad26]
MARNPTIAVSRAEGSPEISPCFGTQSDGGEGLVHVLVVGHQRSYAPSFRIAVTRQVHISEAREGFQTHRTVIEAISGLAKDLSGSCIIGR